jgi:ABC-type amino acid transport system permease subunit
MVFAGFVGLVGIFVLLRGWPGLSSWIINSGSDFWGVLSDKFGDGRGAKPLDAMRPTLTEGRFVNFGPTGLTLTVFYASIFLGLVFYTSAFIAEVVRGGILAVPSGQTEAAAALGLTRAQALRKVVLPQAFRVIMPPLGNQYLNITKNTSLGIAVGFSEIVQVGQTVYNKNSQTLAVFSIYMIFYLSCSLSISAVVNTINRRLAIVER